MLIESRRSDNRAVLLRAGYQEIYENGFGGANLVAISNASKLTKGALFHYFPSKKDLGLAVIQEIRDVLVRRWIKPLRENANPISSLKEILNRFASKATPYSMKYGCPLQNLTLELSATDDDFRKILNTIFEDWTSALADALSKGIDLEYVSPGVNPRKTALFIIGSFYGAVTLGKSYQSVVFFINCLEQLTTYVDSLAASGKQKRKGSG